MQILLIPSWYPTAKAPTKGIFFKEQALALKKEGHKVIVADFHELWSLTDILRPKEDVSGITASEENGLFVYRYKGYDYFPKIYSFKKYLFNYRLKSIYNKVEKDHGRPDIIHAHGIFFGGNSAAWLKNKVNIPVVLTEHSSYIGRNLLQKAYLPMLQNTLKKVDSIIAVGPGLKRTLSDYVEKERIKIIPNCIDTDNFQILSNVKSEISRKTFNFFTLALLSRNKGIDILIKAFAQIKNRNVHLTIGGTGKELFQLKKLATELGIIEKITFLGELNRSQVVKQMNLCDVFILPSKYETFGIVYIEALACGKPIIATDCGGPSLIVKDFNGYLVPPSNISALAVSMEKMMVNHKEFDPVVIRKDCVNRFSEKAVIAQVENVYKELLENKK